MTLIEQVRDLVAKLNAAFPETIVDLGVIAATGRIIWYDTDAGVASMIERQGNGVKLWSDINPWDMREEDWADYTLHSSPVELFAMRMGELA